MLSFKDFITEGKYSSSVASFVEEFNNWAKTLGKSPKKIASDFDYMYKDFNKKGGKNFYAWCSLYVINRLPNAAFEKEFGSKEVWNKNDEMKNKFFGTTSLQDTHLHTFIKEFMKAYEKKYNVDLHTKDC